MSDKLKNDKIFICKVLLINTYIYIYYYISDNLLNDLDILLKKDNQY